MLRGKDPRLQSKSRHARAPGPKLILNMDNTSAMGATSDRIVRAETSGPGQGDDARKDQDAPNWVALSS